MIITQQQVQYAKYRRSQIAELADWTPGFDMSGVSVSDSDKRAGSPKLGDKIARNPVNHADRWLVAADYFLVNFEPIEQGAHPGADVVLTEDQVEWVVNDIAELGVKIGNQFFFLYKGHSLVYGQDSSDVIDGVAVNHDTDPPIKHHWRPVFKREFGECCHPVNYEDLRQCGHPHKWGTVSLGDSDEWKPLPAAPQPQQEQSK